MTDDEQAIRRAVETWMAATRAGDGAAVLALMTEDAVFMVPGHEPFGKAAFAAASAGRGDTGIQGTNEIVELQVLGDWAFSRHRIAVTATPSAGEPIRRSGYTLTLWRREVDGGWRLARDANLLTAEG